MEKDPIIESKLQSETAPIEQARFLDRVDPIYEERWEDLCEIVPDQYTVNTVMVDIWNDEDMPQIFRDRAMLIIGGRHEEYGLTPNNIIDHIYPFNLPRLNSFRFDLMKPWIRDVAVYQQEKDSEDRLFSDSILFHWTAFLYNRGSLDGQELEEYIDLLDSNNVRPHCLKGGDDLWMPSVVLSKKDSFPVLAGVLRNDSVYKNDSKIKRWAVDKLKDWVECQDINTDCQDKRSKLPKWLRDQGCDSDKAQDLFAQLSNQFVQEQTTARNIDWDLIKFGVDRFGIEILYDTEVESHGWRIVEQFKDKTPDMARLIATDILYKRRGNRKRCLSSTIIKVLESMFEEDSVESNLVKIERKLREEDQAKFNDSLLNSAVKRNMEPENLKRIVEQERNRRRYKIALTRLSLAGANQPKDEEEEYIYGSVD